MYYPHQPAPTDFPREKERNLVLKYFVVYSRQNWATFQCAHRVVVLFFILLGNLVTSLEVVGEVSYV